jgi:hypothetical protein
VKWLDVQRRSAAVQELRLGPLNADHVRRLVAELPHPDSADVGQLAARIFARAEGRRAGAHIAGRGTIGSMIGVAASDSGREACRRTEVRLWHSRP